MPTATRPSPITRHSAYAVSLPEFDGPLDLLLRLIEKNELEITRIALAEVADQYLAYVRSAEQQPEVGDIAAFLVVAAKLLYIKSQQLLPKPPLRLTEEQAEEPEDVGEELVRRLQEYQAIKVVAQELRRREESGERSFLRSAQGLEVKPTIQDYGLTGVTIEQLVALARRRTQLAMSLDASSKPRPPSPIQPWRVSVAGRLRELHVWLKEHRRYTYSEVLAAHPASTRLGRAQEGAVTFLAVLELIRRRQAHVEQEEPFGEIYISDEHAR
jgi:segregation and condensation protein A